MTRVRYIMNKYNKYRSSAIADASIYVCCSAEEAEEIKTLTCWYGESIGTIRYSGKYGNTREKRAIVHPFVTESPALWGQKGDLALLCEMSGIAGHLGAGDLAVKCGAPRTWAPHAAQLCFSAAHFGLDSLRDVCAAWANMGQKCSHDFILLISQVRLPTIEQLSALLCFEKYSECPIGIHEKIDCIVAIGTLQVTVKEAIKTYRSVQKDIIEGKYRAYLLGSVEIRNKKAKSFHDFLFDAVEKLEKKSRDQEIKEEYEQKLKAPEGWRYIASPAELIRVSRENGWCSKAKTYWSRIKAGEHFFFCAQKGLAHYSRDGRLLQAEKPFNAGSLRSELPEKLELL